MAQRILAPRKQPTRGHVIADLSVHHVEGFILEEGHSSQRLTSDYGYDLVMFTYNIQGYIEPGIVLFQMKAAESPQTSGADYVLDLDIRDYNLWMLERGPVILVRFDASRKRAYWLAVQEYFRQDASRLPKKGARAVRVRIPMRQRVNRRAIEAIRQLKWETQGPVLGVRS